MRPVICTNTGNTRIGKDGDDSGLVHYNGSPLTGYFTLCGWVDIGTFEETDQKVNCAACLDVVKHVRSKK